MSTSNRWFYADENNQPQGPVSREELSWLAAAGVIAQSSYVIEEGGTEWKIYGDLPTVKPLPKPSEDKERQPRGWVVVLGLVALGVFLWWKGAEDARSSALADMALHVSIRGAAPYRNHRPAVPPSIS